MAHPELQGAVMSGYYSFYFTHLVPQPTNPQDIQQRCGMLVRAGEIFGHAGDKAHHGNCITNAAYALFSAANVDISINHDNQMTEGAVNGTGGMSGAVVAFWRGTNKMHKRLGNATARDDLEKLGLHIFGKSEMERAKVEVALDAAIQAYGEATRGAMNGTGGCFSAVVILMRAVFHFRNTLGWVDAGREVRELAKHILERSELERVQEEVMKT
ncbi:hypothetical protein B0A55_12739, partial [Friedmanniomyces simplex]